MALTLIDHPCLNHLLHSGLQTGRFPYFFIRSMNWNSSVKRFFFSHQLAVDYYSLKSRGLLNSSLLFIFRVRS